MLSSKSTFVVDASGALIEKRVVMGLVLSDIKKAPPGSARLLVTVWKTGARHVTPTLMGALHTCIRYGFPLARE